MSAPAVQVRGLRKSYRTGLLGEERVGALRGVDLQVHRGEVHGLLGANGAGKTTTLQSILGLVHPDGGEGEVMGAPIGSVAARRRIGYLPETFAFPAFLGIEGLLRHYARLYGLDGPSTDERVEAVMEETDLTDLRRRKVGRLSKGQTQKVGLAQALLAEPELLVLDEPTSGLDAVARSRTESLLRELVSRGRTVLFSTHILADAQKLCDRVTILKDGEVAAAGPLEEILGEDTSLEDRFLGLMGERTGEAGA